MKTFFRPARLALPFSLLLAALLACSLLTAPASPTAVPASTALPTEPPMQLYQQVTLTSAASGDQGQPFNYQITIQKPVLTGSDDPRVTAFNAEMSEIVDQAVADFKQNLAGLPPTPVSSASSFDVRYNLLSPPGNVFSIKFEMEGYVTGAAHPYHFSRTANYDLEHGKDLSLPDLFLPGSNYLDAISKYCVSQLSTRDIGFEGFELGAAPIPENYRNWNITADGLLITFDEYHVAPYAAGPQTVIIPYGELGQLIQYQGP